MGAELCRLLKARLYFSSVWSPNQVAENGLVNMSSRELYEGARFICPGYFPEVKRQAYSGRKFMDDFPPVQGHLVIRVDSGGKSWGFSILTTDDESMRVLFHKEMV